MVIKVEHPNGYSGVLYGRGSMTIYDKDGNEVLHTWARNAQTRQDLYEELETMPEFLELLRKSCAENFDD